MKKPPKLILVITAIALSACAVKSTNTKVPSLIALEKSYDTVLAADLFAYTLVDYIANRYGQEQVLALLHSPDRLESLLHANKAEIGSGWRQYIQKECEGQKKEN